MTNGQAYYAVVIYYKYKHPSLLRQVETLQNILRNSYDHYSGTVVLLSE